MNKFVFLVWVLAFSAATGVMAQQQMQDVVYLKDGSIIRGMIIEQVPNVSIKIQTWDGSVFVCKIEDVVKITKEKPLRQIEETDVEEEPNKRLKKELFHPYAESRFSKLVPNARSMRVFPGWAASALGTTAISIGIFAKDDLNREERITWLAIGGSLVLIGVAHIERANRIIDKHSSVMKKPAMSPSEKEERERAASEALIELADIGRKFRMAEIIGNAALSAQFLIFKPYRVYETNYVVDSFGRITDRVVAEKPARQNYWSAAVFGANAFLYLLNKSPEEKAFQGYLKDKESGKTSFSIVPDPMSAAVELKTEGQRVAMTISYRF